MHAKHLCMYKLCVQCSHDYYNMVKVVTTLCMYFMCCIGNAEDKNVPTLVQGLAGHKIVGVELGSGDAHTLALEDNGTKHVK